MKKIRNSIIKDLRLICLDFYVALLPAVNACAAFRAQARKKLGLVRQFLPHLRKICSPVISVSQNDPIPKRHKQGKQFVWR